ncbi:MAG TPA: alpha/beta fold hydrolase [Thermoanaerobaculia bacterium]|nr:alpha/beta fold hydrolase [Thermoanaerobaculia bacterium]
MAGKQQIRFCMAADGVRIAYATAGQGPPLVKTANYLTHLEHDWESPVWRHWLRELARHHTLVRYDQRGCGLSDWNVDDLSMDGWLRDLETVVDAAGLERFALLGLSQGAAVAVAYAARHPDRVTHLVLYGGYAQGRLSRSTGAEEVLEAETLINVIRVGWGRDNPAFRQIFTTLLMPEASEEQKRWLDHLARISTTPDNAAAMERAFYGIDVVREARSVSARSLVAHARDDAAVPFEAGRALASLVPGARFLQLASRNHVLTEDEPAWARFVAEVHEFLGSVRPETAAAEPRPDFPELTSREREVLELLARGLDNDAIAGRLFVTSKTVRNYVSTLYGKLQVPSRGRAIVLAREAGLGRDAAVDRDAG